jgi:hypothetical protein
MERAAVIMHARALSSQPAQAAQSLWEEIHLSLDT